jgi:ketosteroid isomerase-like protein
VKTKFVILLVATLFGLGALIAYQGVRAQSKPTGKGEGLRVMNTQEQVEKLLREFLAGVDTPAAHDRFWADDLVYTSAGGVRRSKAEILKNVTEGASKPADPKEPKTTFAAEDVVVHDYGDFAIVNFQLVAHADESGKPQTQNYRNTGTLRKQNGEWKVIAWQATKIEKQ